MWHRLMKMSTQKLVMLLLLLLSACKNKAINPRAFVWLSGLLQFWHCCLIILQIKSGEGGHIIGLRNLNWNLHKWNASVTSASHLMQRPTWRWRRWWRWPGWWWAKKRWWSYTDPCFVPCTLRRLANEQGVSYSDYVISSNLASVTPWTNISPL